MLMIEAVQRFIGELGALPRTSRIGVVVIVMAGMTDIAVHALGIGAGPHQHGFAAEHAAHLLGIVGMVLVLAGVVDHGARRSHRRPTTASNGGLERNAPR